MVSACSIHDAMGIQISLYASIQINLNAHIITLLQRAVHPSKQKKAPSSQKKRSYDREKNCTVK